MKTNNMDDAPDILHFSRDVGRVNGAGPGPAFVRPSTSNYKALLNRFVNNKLAEMPALPEWRF